MLLQNLSDWLKSVLGDSELPIKQLKDLLPLTTVPIFRRSIYESDLAETVFEVSSNPAYSKLLSNDKFNYSSLVWLIKFVQFEILKQKSKSLSSIQNWIKY